MSNPATNAEDFKSYIQENKDRFIQELFELLRIPSVSTDKKFKDDVLRAAEFLKEKLEIAGADAVEGSDHDIPEVVAVPILLGLAAFTFYRKVRRFDAGTYLLALGGAAAVTVGLWYLGLGLHRGALFSPDRLTVELMGIALGVQLVAVVVAVLVIAGVQRMRETE